MPGKSFSVPFAQGKSYNEGKQRVKLSVYFQIALLMYDFIKELSTTPLYREEWLQWKKLICVFIIFVCLCGENALRASKDMPILIQILEIKILRTKS